MKIFYKYNGFTRSSELSTNFNGDYNTNYALLGSFDEDLWNLFGIFYVYESWSGESLEYVIEGFNEEGNGKTVSYEGETFEILRETFGGIWNDVWSQEDFEALFKPQVERLTIKIVPNPELANDKDDIYTYLNPENRDILSCSSVEIKVPQPDIDCIPTSAEYIGPSIILTPMQATVSINGGPKKTDYFYSILKELSLTSDSSSGSEFWLGSRLTDNGVSTTIISGFDNDGNSYNPDGSILNTKSEISNLTGKVLTLDKNQSTILEIYPSPNAGFGLDCYKHFSVGNDFGDPVTIISCAKVLKEEVISFGKRIRVATGTDHIKSDDLYTYRPEAEGSNGEKVVNISNLFADSSFDADGKLIGRNDGWSDWSAPIDFSDINHVMSNGGLTIISNPNVSANSWIDMTNVSNVELFAQELKNNIYGSNLEYKDFG